ncbi:MAG TPA: hypothetical protein VMS65_09490, partial [Polyangiaceae bacterium]|nr:hypothetical protein [Polyangiaceae bacterium]
MKLQTTTPSGSTYRLRSAIFTIVDPTGVPVGTLDSEGAPPDAAVLSASLGIGTYTISLASGWFVERNGQVVDALLTSGVARPFTVFVDSSTVVSYAFKVEGEPIVIGGTLPWTGYLVSAARSVMGNRLRLVVWGWFVAGLVFLSVGESKLVTYVLPLFPALAILAGERIVAAGTFGGRAAYGLLASTLALLPIAALIAVSYKFGG